MMLPIMDIIHIQLSDSYYRGPQYHLEKVSSPRFLDLLSQFGLTQHVAATTHVFALLLLRQHRARIRP